MVRWGDNGVGGVGSRWWRWLWRDDDSGVRMMMVKVACRGDDGVEVTMMMWMRCLRHISDQTIQTPEQLENYLAITSVLSIKLAHQMGVALAMLALMSSLISQVEKDLVTMSSYQVKNGFLYLKNRMVIPLESSALITKLLVKYHSSTLDIHNFIRSCQICQRAKTSQLHPAGFLFPLPIPNQVWEDVAMDFITGLPNSRGGIKNWACPILLYFGVLKQIGPIAYKQESPITSRIHPVFHVSFLKPCVGEPSDEYILLSLLSTLEGPLVHPIQNLDSRKFRVNDEWEIQVLVQRDGRVQHTWESWNQL
ncbi:hypothetical protein Tco_0581133 [Tanacetum coccineum]